MKVKIRKNHIIEVPNDLQLIKAARRLWNWNFNSVDIEKITKTKFMEIYQEKLNKLVVRLRTTRNHYYELIYSASQDTETTENKEILVALKGWQHLNYLKE